MTHMNAAVADTKSPHSQGNPRPRLLGVAAILVGISLLTTLCSRAADDSTLLDIERKVFHSPRPSC